MSQEEVYKIIKEFGGEATYKEIKQRAKEKFPGLSLYQYVGNRLMRLEKNGYVERMRNKKGEIVYKIIDDWP